MLKNNEIILEGLEIDRLAKEQKIANAFELANAVMSVANQYQALGQAQLNSQKTAELSAASSIKSERRRQKEVDRINKETNNEQEAGVAILESALMLRQQMSTAGKVGGRRAQLFLGKEFLQEIRKNTPGLEFTIKETVDKNNKKSYSIDYSKPKLIKTKC